MYESKKLSVPISILVLVLLGIHTVISDFCSCIWNGSYVVTTLIGLTSTAILFLLVRKHLRITCQWDKEDIIFFIILGVLLIIHIPMADEMYDTINYHLYLQERPFTSKLIEDFFPGRYINSFSYAFADRMFYFFRFFLGYRLGVILNYIIMIALYYQVKDILRVVLTKKTRWISIFAMISVFSLSILEQIDNYYVDLLSLVFLLELGRQALKTDKEDSFFLKTILYMLVAGMAFAVKISNAFFIIVFSLIYLGKNWKEIRKMRWWQIPVYLLAFCFPFLLYTAYTWIETGNPVFPFYNTIFHSPYYPDANWMDTRFGPKTLIEFLLWPLYGVRHPERVADTHICEPMWAVAYIVTIFYIIDTLIRILRKKEPKKFSPLLLLSFITLALYLIWAKFLLGYTRYAIIVITFATITTLLILYEIFQKKRYVFFTIFFLGFLWNGAYSSYQYLYSGKGLFYDHFANTTWSNYWYNVKHLTDSNQEIISFPENSAWGVIAENSGDCIMINNTLPILNLTWGAATPEAQTLLNENLEKYDHIYTTVSYLQLDYFLGRLNDYSWQIESYYDTVVPSHLEEQGSYYIFEISQGEDKNTKAEGYSELLLLSEDEKEVAGYIGIHPRFRYLAEPCSFAIYGQKDQKEVLLETIENVEAGELYFVRMKNEDYSKIIVKSSTSSVEPPHIIWIQSKGSDQ